MSKKNVTDNEKVNLWQSVNSEGFGYYMLQYGPDLNLIERLGYSRDELDKAITLFSKIEREIMSFENLIEEEE